MSDKIIGVICLATSVAIQAWMRHGDSQLFYSWLFGGIGVIQLLLGEMRMRKGNECLVKTRNWG